ncbi:hypothetical protein [Dyadobacter sp. NIV53]|uniref:hypothetical protein n=1 Tax=Dyadobacter sp. NIV53 TaxID=2861765 RepID=UPI001C8897F0|nr:hypothetical protein [Dyadobacter sp. NIV53]
MDLKQNAESNKDYQLLRIGSRDPETQKASIFLGNDLLEAVWGNLERYDELITPIDEIIKDTPDDLPIVISRDELHSSIILKRDNVNTTFFVDEKLGGRSWINPAELMKELKKKYPSKRFYLSRGITGISRIKRLPTIKGPQDIAAYMPTKGSLIKEDLIARMKQTLQDGKIKIVEVDDTFLSADDNIPESNILLVSGHKDETFESFLKTLADNGKLIHKVVAIFSCFERGTTDLQAYLIHNGYASNVIFFPIRISPSATQALIQEITAILPKVTDINKNGVLMDECIEMALNNALNNPDYLDLNEELIQLSALLNQISFNSKPTQNGKS